MGNTIKTGGFVSRNTNETKTFSNPGVDSERVGADRGKKALPKELDAIYHDPQIGALTASDLMKRSFVAEAPTPFAKKTVTSRQSNDFIAQEALARIKGSARCKEGLDAAQANNVPEIFIDSKEKGRRVSNLGQDIINGRDRDLSLVRSGQQPQGPTAWGRVLVYLPGSPNLEILRNFSDVLKDKIELDFIADIVEISSINLPKYTSLCCPHSSTARFDLMFRFGLLGSEKSEVKAQQIRNLIPEEDVSDAFSFALQNAVQFQNLSMIRYCLDNGARPFSPDEGLYDSREFSPIELAFRDGTQEIQELLIRCLDRPTDLAELKKLFLDQDRWMTPPPRIIDFIKVKSV